MEGLLLQQAKLIGLELPKGTHKLPFAAVYAVGDPASDIAGARAAGQSAVHFMACMTPAPGTVMQIVLDSHEVNATPRAGLLTSAKLYLADRMHSKHEGLPHGL